MKLFIVKRTGYTTILSLQILFLLSLELRRIKIGKQAIHS